MWISVNTMSTPEFEAELAERLGRLKGGPACCVPEYASEAGTIRRAPHFSRALERAKALSDEHRLLAVALLRRRKELCACEIQAGLGLTHATVSHHMGILVRAGFVTERREGKWMYYRLADRAELEVP